MNLNLFLRNLACVLLVACSWMLSSGCASTSDGVTPTAAVESPTNAVASTTDLLRQGDLVALRFTGISNPPPLHEERIREDGTISPSTLFKPVTAAGKTVLQLQRELQDLYSRFYRNLTVTVGTEGRYFVVRGEVRNPNRFQYTGELTVLKAIATAGDFTDFGNRKKVEITRANGKKILLNCVKAQKDPSKDVPIYPNDQIWVPRRLF